MNFDEKLKIISKEYHKKHGIYDEGYYIMTTPTISDFYLKHKKEFNKKFKDLSIIREQKDI